MKELVLVKNNSLVVFMTMFFVAFITPLLFNQQIVVGSIVNATLFLTTMFLGFRYGAVVGILPSTIALSTGLLPFSVMVPFIMLANIILVFSFYCLKERSYWFAVTFSAFFKFSFLSLAVFFVLEAFPFNNIASQMFLMMGWMQLLTALLGGVLAFVYIKTTS